MVDEFLAIDREPNVGDQPKILPSFLGSLW
jgi:hypothetical protein